MVVLPLSGGSRLPEQRYERRGGRFLRGVAVGTGAMLAIALGGCAVGDNDAADKAMMRGVNSAERSVRAAQAETGSKGVSTAQRPAAIVGNESVSWADLNAGLAEAAGATVLEEFALDRVIQQEMRARALELEPGAVEGEAAILEEALAVSAGVPVERQGDLVQQLRRSRGLGDKRYNALLKRNAMLRRMVREGVVVSADDVKQAHEIRYGPKFETRVIVTETEREAAGAAARIRAGERFADVAVTTSTDPSRMRGGYIGAISPADPSFQLALRKAIIGATPGQPGGVVALDQGYALVFVEGVIAPTNIGADSVAASLEREIRLVRERASMDRLAAQLLRAANVTVLDPALDWSWRNRVQEPQ